MNILIITNAGSNPVTIVYLLALPTYEPKFEKPSTSAKQ
jgi:hypothetical protein